MKVILLQNVPKVGKKFDVVDVSNGYATNFLYPQKLAEIASVAKMNLLQKKKETEAAAEESKMVALAEKLDHLAENPVTITVKADDQGHLFKKLRAEDIVEALKKVDVHLSKESILLDTPLHKVGEHIVPVQAADKKATLTVVVVAE